jgi:hypothetical protein
MITAKQVLQLLSEAYGVNYYKLTPYQIAMAVAEQNLDNLVMAMEELEDIRTNLVRNASSQREAEEMSKKIDEAIRILRAYLKTHRVRIKAA